MIKFTLMCLPLLRKNSKTNLSNKRVCLSISVKQKCSENMTLKIETMYMQLQKVIKIYYLAMDILWREQAKYNLTEIYNTYFRASFHQT